MAYYKITNNMVNVHAADGSTIPSGAYTNNKINFTIETDAGCTFEGIEENSLKYQFQEYGSTTWYYRYPTISDDYKTATFNFQMVANTQNASFEGGAIKTTATVDITNNMINVDSDAPTSVIIGDTLTINITPKDGYTFDGGTTDELPHLTYNTSDGTTNTVNAIIDGEKALITLQVEDDFSNLVLSGGAIKIRVFLPVTNEMTNVQGDIPTEVEVYKTLSVEVTPLDGYTFASALSSLLPYVEYTTPLDGKVTKNADIDGEKATISLLIGSNYSNITLKGGAIKSTSKTITNQMTYVHGDIPTSVKDSDTLNITVTPDDGYTFANTPSGATPYIEYTYTDTGETITQYFTLNSDKSKATLSLSMSSSYTDLVLKGGATPVSYETKNYGTINAYIVTNDDLDTFAQKRFVKEVTTSGTTVTDVGNYIYSIKRIFLPCENGLEDTLKIGDYNFSDIKVHQPKQDTITATYRTNSLAEISSAQFANCKVKVFVPFKGLIDIGTEIFHHDYCGMVLSVNVLSGKGTITIYVEDEDERTNIYYDEFEPSSDVLFTTSNTNSIGQLAENDAKENWGLTPYFAIYSNATYSGDNQPILNCKIPNTYPLKQYSGKMSFDDVSISSTNSLPLMLKEDVEEIKDLLRNGVVL